MVKKFLFFLGQIIFLSSIFFSGCGYNPEKCAFCLGIIPKETSCIVRVDDGSSKRVCCPRCALRYQKESHRKIQLTQVTDYDTFRPLNAVHSFYVEGSDIAPCCRFHLKMDEAKRPYYLRWHRCLPSIVAFETGEKAFRFKARHGGKLLSYEDLFIFTP